MTYICDFNEQPSLNNFSDLSETVASILMKFSSSMYLSKAFIFAGWIVRFRNHNGDFISANIVRSDMGMVNGVIHQIDAVLADLSLDPSTGDWISATATTSASQIMIVLAFIWSLLVTFR